MKNTILLCCLLPFSFAKIWSQDLRNSISYFKNGSNDTYAALDFSKTSKTTASLPEIYTTDSFVNSSGLVLGSQYATVSDSDGFELFTTDGINIWQNFQSSHLLLKGTLKGAAFDYTNYYQNVIIVPRPLHPLCYYVLTISSSGLYYTEVDLEAMTLKNLNTPLKTDNGSEINTTVGNYSNAITATTHTNGIDYWVVAHINNSNYNKLYSYLVTQNGIVQDPQHNFATPNAGASKNLKISKSGDAIERFALANEGTFYSGIFNRSTGELIYDSSYSQGIYSNTKSVEFSTNRKDDLFVLYDDGDLFRNGIQIGSNPSYKSIQIGQDEKLYITGLTNSIIQINLQTNPISSNQITLSSQTITSAMSQLVPFNSCFVASLPIFNILAFEQYGNNYTLPNTSLNGIVGTWSPAIVSTGENNYTFTPNVGQCATETTISILSVNTNLLEAKNDAFDTFIYMDSLLVTPSVLNNDLYNNRSVSTSSVKTTFVSLVADNDSYLPTEEEFYNCTSHHYVDFFRSDGTFAVPWECFPTMGTFILTYKITSNLCPKDTATGKAILSFDSPIGLAKNSNNDKKLNDIIEIYPNPSDGFFNIDLTHVKEDYNTIKVYSLLGEQIAESKLMLMQLNAIDISVFPAGYYIAHLSGENKAITLKLIKK